MSQQDFFLKLEGIEGESKDQSHSSEIQLQSYAFGGARPPAGMGGGGGGSGKVVLQDLHCVKSVDKASPKIFLAMVNGQKIPKAKLSIRKAGKVQVEYLAYEMEEVYVTSFNVSGNATGEEVIPQETFSLSFAKIVVDYKEQNKDGTLSGSVKGGFDLRTHKPS